jgi:chromosome partitioning protein
MDHQELIQKVSNDKSTFLVLDSEPRLKEIARAMIMLSDLVLIPVATSAAEVWATGDVIQLLEEAKKVRKVEARLVWSRHRANTKLAKEVMAEVQKVLGVGFLKTSLGLRVAYQEALGLGLTGAEMSDKMAKEEVNQLVKEVLSIVGSK